MLRCTVQYIVTAKECKSTRPQTRRYSGETQDVTFLSNYEDSSGRSTSAPVHMRISLKDRITRRSMHMRI